VIKKEIEKILKYKDLIIEIQRMWNVKAKVILVIIGVTGTISKSLIPYFSNLPEKHEIKELQKNNHNGHCTHTAGSANVKYTTCFTRDITLHAAQVVNTEQLQHCVP
jgi:hypothetical protein